ncbi:hypothetical protein CHELA1G11_21664 [Hyphomicrobiales bacterium]|nr:hypothetical protein CHELA1G11_21664 [Hyphomicrobiales bacterium]CAH1695388.1 hypothetical protein CHELA1G2_21969 [Hyphomicrobiales bacterium]
MFKGRHFDRSVILSRVHGCRAYGLSSRDPQEIMAERGIGIDHSTIHRWVIHFALQFATINCANGSQRPKNNVVRNGGSSSRQYILVNKSIAYIDIWLIESHARCRHVRCSARAGPMRMMRWIRLRDVMP